MRQAGLVLWQNLDPLSSIAANWMRRAAAKSVLSSGHSRSLAAEAGERAGPERRFRHHLGVDPPLIFGVAPRADRMHLPHMRYDEAS
jgi:hypothetical protein